MKLPDGMGLVCAGGLSQSFLTRLPALTARLGPIKAPSFRVARQMSNTLRAGSPASHYSALDGCPMIWVSVPEASLDRVLRDLAVRTPIRKAPFTKTMVVLCGCERDSLAPDALKGTGARVATLNPVPDTQEKIFVAEGHAATVRALRALLEKEKRKLICLAPAGKSLYFAGIHMSAPLLLPWIAAGMECLRASGFTRAEAVQVGEILGSRAIKKYGKAGVKAWNRHIAAGLRRALDQDVAKIQDACLAERYEQGIRIALGVFR
ncbi:MAG TPA: hypothetical protein VGN17_00580 [Bryobacteraceae bacterium]|jgi:hypothetical protein